MPTCPECNSAYETSTKICKKCGAQLADAALGEFFLDEDNLALLTICTQMYEAEIIKANLESADIDAFILSQQDSNYPFLGNESAIKIFVKKDDEESARDYLDNINNQTPTTDEEE